MSSKSPHPAVVSSAALLAVTTVLALRATAPTDTHDGPAVTPLLTPPTICAQPRAPAQRAHTLLRIAEAKLDAQWVVLGHGAAAWSMLAEAALCARWAGDPTLAATLDARAAQLRITLERDHALRQVRLRHALERGEEDLARSEGRALRSLRGPRTGDYDLWLRRVAEGGAP
jgi:hypothetical protein